MYDLSMNLAFHKNHEYSISGTPSEEVRHFRLSGDFAGPGAGNATKRTWLQPKAWIKKQMGHDKTISKDLLRRAGPRLSDGEERFAGSDYGVLSVP